MRLLLLRRCTTTCFAQMQRHFALRLLLLLLLLLRQLHLQAPVCGHLLRDYVIVRLLLLLLLCWLRIMLLVSVLLGGLQVYDAKWLSIKRAVAVLTDEMRAQLWRCDDDSHRWRQYDSILFEHVQFPVQLLAFIGHLLAFQAQLSAFNVHEVSLAEQLLLHPVVLF